MNKQVMIFSLTACNVDCGCGVKDATNCTCHSCQEGWIGGRCCGKRVFRRPYTFQPWFFIRRFIFTKDSYKIA